MENAVRTCESSLLDVRTSTPHVLIAASSTCYKLLKSAAEYVQTQVLDHCTGVLGCWFYPTGDANGTCVVFIRGIEN